MKYFIVFTLFYSSMLFSQVATYPLDVDLTDNTNGYNGIATGTINFLTEGPKSFAHRNAGSLIQLPTEVNSAIVNNNFQFSFDFRTASASETSIIFSSRANLNPFWEQAGFSVLQWGNEIMLTYDDNISGNGYSWKSIGNVEINQWKNYKFTFDFANNYYKVEIDGVIVYHEPMPAHIDANGFKSGIQNNFFTVGGHNNSVDNITNGVFDIDNLIVYDQVPSMDGQINDAFIQLTNDITGIITLTEAEKLTHLNTIKDNLYFADYSVINTNLFAYTSVYELNNLPLYNSGVTYLEHELPTHDRALLFSQSYVFATQFVDGNAQNMTGLVFEHHEVIPGTVDASAVNIASANAQINGTYNIDIAAELTDQTRVVRPTGYYVRPGDVVTVTVPAGIVNSGVSVIVGSHFRNMEPDYIGRINRFEDISAEYNLTTTTISVANPFGGGIYIKIPAGTNLGLFNITISNAIKMPFFSYKANHQTSVSDWLNEVATSKAPWADFESDKFMFTIPVAELVGVTNPDAIMQRWDDMMDAINVAAGRPMARPRAEYYSFDTRLVTPAYGAGYPLIIPINEMRAPNNGIWNPLNVVSQPMHYTLLHEMGHNHLLPTLNFGDPDFSVLACHNIEAETNIHTLAFAINNLVYNMSIEDAFAYSAANLDQDPVTFEEAVFDWIITTNFRQNSPMTFDYSTPSSLPDKDMLKYQPRGWAKYGDIVKLYGWTGLGSLNGAFYNAGVQQSSTVCSDRSFIVGRDEYVLAATNAIGENMAPLFHFWGINPTAAMQTQLAAFPKSQKIKALIENYQCTIAPLTMDDYLAYHNTIFQSDNYQWPRYQEYVTQFDATFAQQIQSQFDFILQNYGLIGSPAPTNVQGTINNTTISLTWTDNATDETGYLIKMKGPLDADFINVFTTAANITSFNTTISQVGSYQFKVTALNIDNLESNVCEVETITVDATLSSDDFTLDNQIKLFPNPAKSIIEIKGNTEQLKEIKIYSLTGKLVKHFTKNLNKFNINDLETGIYLVKAISENSVKTIKLIKY